MPSAENTVIINQPIEEVFAFFTSPANDQKWRPHVKEISAQGAPAVGSRIHQVVYGPGGRGIPADIEVTAYEPSSHYAFQVVAGPARPRGEFHFTPSGSGTRVTFALTTELTGVKKVLMSKPVQSSMNGEVDSLTKAKALLEEPEARLST